MGSKTEEFKFLNNKVIIQSNGRLCDSPDELLRSNAFRMVLEKTLSELSARRSRLLKIFGDREINQESISTLIQVLQYLTILDQGVIPAILPDSEVFFTHLDILWDFVEYLYDSWRNYDRFVIVSSENGDSLDDRPYRTFNATVEKLMHLVISTYRDIQENISGVHPRVYRQVRAGVDIAAIVSSKSDLTDWTSSLGTPYQALAGVPIIRQVLLNPPLVLNQPTNKRSGEFLRILENPLDLVEFKPKEWVCYPALVGELLILTYIQEEFLEFGLSLCNLFELADDEDLKRKPDAIYLYGSPGG
ncbi:MAG: hypothetical protein MUP11_03465, partial [Anaerolineales bacterium]|nr:hypothetical protein [Anaerolineales bacterium]